MQKNYIFNPGYKNIHCCFFFVVIYIILNNKGVYSPRRRWRRGDDNLRRLFSFYTVD